MVVTDPQALEVARWFLALFFPAVALFYIVRLTMLRRRRGGSAVFHGAKGSRQWWLAKTFVVFRSVITLVMLARAFWPALDAYLLVFAFMMTPAVVVTGLALLVAGFASVLVLHYTMGAAWRSGISDESAPLRGAAPRLLTGGAYAFTRNPMFLAIQLGQIGFFLAFPSGFTLICLVVGMTVLHLQTRLEEEHLLALHGQAYRAYCERTPRWLPLRRSRFAPKSGTPSNGDAVTH